MNNILGIDPGLTRLGWGAVGVNGEELTLGLSGLIAHPRDTDLPYNKYLNDGILQITEKFPVILSVVQPISIYAEIVPPGRLGSRSELVVAAITTCKVIAFQWGIVWNDVGANTVKKIITDDGTATKARVRNAVIDAFPSIGAAHKKAKLEQKEQGEKRPEGIPQDVFDGIAIAMAGATIDGNSNNR
jgi:Holliday junction resolvasome RuvABC endonuclease subunit